MKIKEQLTTERVETRWKIDPAHSEIMFQAKCLMLTVVTGFLTEFDVELETAGETFSTTSSIRFTANASSVNTNHKKRDRQLKSAAFFDAANFEHITFTAHEFDADQASGPSGFLHYLSNDHTLTGKLTIKNITKPVQLKVQYIGKVKGEDGQPRAGFTLSGKLSRADFGLDWNGNVGGAKMIINDEILIKGNIQLLKQEN